MPNKKTNLISNTNQLQHSDATNSVVTGEDSKVSAKKAVPVNKKSRKATNDKLQIQSMDEECAKMTPGIASKERACKTQRKKFETLG